MDNPTLAELRDHRRALLKRQGLHEAEMVRAARERRPCAAQRRTQRNFTVVLWCLALSLLAVVTWSAVSSHGGSALVFVLLFFGLGAGLLGWFWRAARRPTVLSVRRSTLRGRSCRSGTSDVPAHYVLTFSDGTSALANNGVGSMMHEGVCYAMHQVFGPISTTFFDVSMPDEASEDLPNTGHRYRLADGEVRLLVVERYYLLAADRSVLYTFERAGDPVHRRTVEVSSLTTRGPQLYVGTATGGVELCGLEDNKVRRREQLGAAPVVSLQLDGDALIARLGDGRVFTLDPTTLARRGEHRDVSAGPATPPASRAPLSPLAQTAFASDPETGFVARGFADGIVWFGQA